MGLLEKPGGLGMLAVLTDGVGAGEFMATAHRGRGAGGKEPAEAIVMRQDGLSGADYLLFESVDIKMVVLLLYAVWSWAGDPPRKVACAFGVFPSPALPGRSERCQIGLCEDFWSLSTTSTVPLVTLLEGETVLFGIFRHFDSSKHDPLVDRRATESRGIDAALSPVQPTS